MIAPMFTCEILLLFVCVTMRRGRGKFGCVLYLQEFVSALRTLDLDVVFTELNTRLTPDTNPQSKIKALYAIEEAVSAQIRNSENIYDKVSSINLNNIELIYESSQVGNVHMYVYSKSASVADLIRSNSGRMPSFTRAFRVQRKSALGEF